MDAWTERHVLAALLLSQAHDHIGNLLIGDRAARAYLAHQANPFPALLPEDTDARVRRYTGAVRSLALSGSQSGTSVNGEQPKFVVDIEGTAGSRALIVKFSGPRSTDAGQRWSDLLRMEHHALNVIRELLGIDAARTAVVADQDRTYLEVERFDRHPDGHRSGVISFSSLDAEFVGLGEGWTPVGAALVHGGHLEPSALAVIRQLELFADLIGNNDRHLGNMSAHFEGNRPMRLTPIYDFLPMRYAPTSTGEIPADPLDLAGVVARHPDVSAGDASRCQAATVEFWQRCGADTEISEQMRRLSCVHRGHPG